MMNLLRRRALMIAAQQNTVPVWDGVTVTTPALVDGYYEIYDGATLAGFNNLTVNNKKGRVTADFALNENYVNYENWGISAPANFWAYKGTGAGSISEFDGQGHSIYGMYGSGSLLAGAGLGTNGRVKNIKLLNFYKKDTELSHHREAILAGMNCSTSNLIYNIIAEGTHDFGSIPDNYDGVGGIVKAISSNDPNSNAHSLLSKIKFINVFASACPIGGVAGRVGWNGGTLRNCGSICSTDGGLNSLHGAGVHGGVVGGYYTSIYNNCWSSSHMAIQNNGATPVAIGPGSSFSNCYYDSTKLVGTAQGTAKTTDEIKSQAFVDLLNATLPTGCTPWKLGTDNYPTLDF